MANNEIDNSVLKKLQQWFKIGFKKNAEKPSDQVFPIHKSVEITTDKSGKVTKKEIHFDREKFSPEAEKLWDYWFNNCHDSQESWKNREALYDDMDLLYYNSPIIARAVELIADEVIQADSNNQPIFIEAKAKVKKFIEKFFDDIKLYDHLRPTLLDLIQYGNSGWILTFDKTGVTEIVPISPRMIKDRLEFSPVALSEQLNTQNAFFGKYKSLDRVNELINSILNKKDSSSYFKEYLIGFQIGDSIVPPWKFLHFRNVTNKSPFKPFGVPQFIHAMAPYRQYDAAMGLQQVARGAKFPKDLYKIDMPNVISPDEKMSKAMEFLSELQNSGFGNSKKEIPGLGETIITVKDLFDYEQITPNIELGNIDDIALLRDDLINATFIPRNLIDPNDSSFGDSGVALAEKFKPFARMVYRYQSMLLQNITQLVKIHMIYSNQFSVDEIDFILSMPYPEAQTNGDIITSQSSLLSLANDIISALQDKITGGEPLPPEIVKGIYNKFLPYDADVVDSWIDDAIKAKEEADAEKEELGDGESFGDSEDITSDIDAVSSETENSSVNEEDYNTFLGDISSITPEELQEKAKRFKMYSKLQEEIRARKVWSSLEKIYSKNKIQEMIASTIFEKKQSFIRDTVIKERHCYSSKNKYGDFDTKQFKEFDKERLKLIEKNENVDKFDKEEISLKEYVFTRDPKLKEKKLAEKKKSKKKAK